MREDQAAHERLCGLDRSLGPAARDLLLGRWRIRIEGLGDGLAESLGRRYGPFLRESDRAASVRLLLRVLDAGAEAWLPLSTPGELYRIEARSTSAGRLVLSHSFALCSDGGAFRLGLSAPVVESSERAIENALRFLAARLAIEDGGFAMHAAGLLREGRAFLFAGPSGAGKTSLMRIAQPAASLGDDFGLVVRDDHGWAAPALPFDNAEQVASEAPQGLYPLAGIWRLAQARRTRVEPLPAPIAVAALLGCAAFPWAMPELADRLLEHARSFVVAGRFERLHFALDAPLWTELV